MHIFLMLNELLICTSVWFIARDHSILKSAGAVYSYRTFIIFHRAICVTTSNVFSYTTYSYTYTCYFACVNLDPCRRAFSDNVSRSRVLVELASTVLRMYYLCKAREQTKISRYFCNT